MADRALEEPQVTEAAQGAALEVFVRFTERTNTVHHPQVLIETAADLLHETIPSATIAFHPAERDHWSVLARRGAIPPEVRAVQDRGLPLDEPQLLRPFQQGCPLFFEWDPGVAMIPEAASYQVVAYYPYWREGVPFGFFGMGSLAGPACSARERTVFLALGRALQLALERAWHAEERESRIQELERQVHTGRVFAELTQDLTFNDPAALTREAEHLLFRLLPGASVQYWTQQDGEGRVAAGAAPERTRLGAPAAGGG